MMKREQYVDRALRAGYRIRDVNGMTTYELSRLTSQPVMRPYQPYMTGVGTSSTRLTPSEEMALKKYFKGK